MPVCFPLTGYRVVADEAQQSVAWPMVDTTPSAPPAPIRGQSAQTLRFKKGALLLDELVQRLSEGDHPVMVGGLQPAAAKLKQRIEEIGYVFIKFTDTRGGTDLGVRVNKAATDLSAADFEQATGSVHVEGTLTLNYVSVRCVADINLATLNGTGHLVILEEVQA
jgi:hypothetical protein